MVLVSAASSLRTSFLSFLSEGRKASKQNLLVESPDIISAFIHAAGPGTDITSISASTHCFTSSSPENLQPTQIEEMTEKTEESDEWDLTLFTCTTGGSARCAVRCVRTGYPVLTTETAE